MNVTKRNRTAILFAIAGLGLAATGWAQDTAAAVPAATDAVKEGMSNMRIALDTVWVLFTGMLVFWMNAGFAMVESGLCRAKNCVNILAKNFIVFALATLSFWIIGWGLMFGDGTPWLGLKGLFLLSGADNSPALGSAYAAMNPFSSATYEGVYSAINWTPVPLWAKFFFQLVFAGTAATIVSGAVAERIKFKASWPSVCCWSASCIRSPVTGSGAEAYWRPPRLRRDSMPFSTVFATSRVQRSYIRSAVGQLSPAH